MASKQGELKLTPHSLDIPYGFTLFGKSFSRPLTCEFGYTGDLKEKHQLEIYSLTSEDESGLCFDMMFLVEDDDSACCSLLLSGILNNHKYWDLEEKERQWW